MPSARAHDLTSDQVERIEVTTFHEAVRLATNQPNTIEEAQCSTSFPCAVALVRGDITPADIADEALNDPEILRLSKALTMTESQQANDNFPQGRLAKVSLILRNGTRVDGPYMSPRWDHLHPPTEAELRDKFHALADPVLGQARATAIERALSDLPYTPLSALTDLLFQPIN